MKYLLFLVINIALLSCTTTAQQQNTDVDVSTFQQDLTKDNVQVLDVRTAGEFQGGYIKNAMLADWTNPDQFKDRVQYLDKSKPVLVYCASGGRSGQAAQWLAKNGFTTVENLKGGFTQWKIQNKPVEGAKNVTQITADDYKNYITSSNVVLIDFGADWCPPCRKMTPVIDELQTELKDQFKLVKVDGGVNITVMQQQHVEALPTFIIYKNGKEVWRKQGIVEKTELIAQLNK
ncbi:MAG: thioredoxin domain-containing protein [Panacibacter sp.]